MRNEFLKHAAIAFFAVAWADLVEENGGILRGEILDQIPAAIDPGAMAYARILLDKLEKQNGKTVEELLNFIEDNASGDRDPNAEYFGHYAAMQAMGHGVGLHDAFGGEVYDTIKVPYIEFGMHNLERDYA